MNFLSLTTSTTDTLYILLTILLLIIAYLLGAIPFGLVIGKGICHIDIREHGSKNIGTTNSIRVLGKKYGFLVFFCDVLKGMLVIILLKVLEEFGVWTTPIDHIYFGVASIIGHFFPIYLGFKGGKGVATSLGVVLILTPTPAIACLVIFLLLLYTTGYVSIGSTFAALTVVTASWVLYFFGIEYTNILEYFIAKPSLEICIFFSFVALFIILKHIKNYKRLFNGTENNFKKKKKEQI